MAPQIFIPILCYNHLCNTEFMMSLMRLLIFLKEKNIAAKYRCIPFESLISRGRNAAAAFFLSDPEATHLLFLDSDIEFAPEDVIRMLAADRDVIAAIYPYKHLRVDRLRQALEGGAPEPLAMASMVGCMTNVPDADVIQVDYAPTGFMMIKRGVLETLAVKNPGRNYKNDIDGYYDADPSKFFDFFRVEVHPETRRYESEDYSFCRMWREAGGKVNVLTDVTLVHHGWYGYKGNLAEQTRFFSGGSRQ